MRSAVTGNRLPRRPGSRRRPAQPVTAGEADLRTLKRVAAQAAALLARPRDRAARLSAAVLLADLATLAASLRHQREALGQRLRQGPLRRQAMAAYAHQVALRQAAQPLAIHRSNRGRQP